MTTHKACEAVAHLREGHHGHHQHVEHETHLHHIGGALRSTNLRLRGKLWSLRCLSTSGLYKLLFQGDLSHDLLGLLLVCDLRAKHAARSLRWIGGGRTRSTWRTEPQAAGRNSQLLSNLLLQDRGLICSIESTKTYKCHLYCPPH